MKALIGIIYPGLIFSSVHSFLHINPAGHLVRDRSRPSRRLNAINADEVTIRILYESAAASIVDGRGIRRSWVFEQNLDDFWGSDDDSLELVLSYGREPSLPDLINGETDLLEDYLIDLLRNRQRPSNNRVVEFSDVPVEVVSTRRTGSPIGGYSDEDDDTPVLETEVVDAEWSDMDGKRYVRSGDASRPSDPSLSSVGITGAVVGAILGGPLGAVVGTMAATRLAKRDDSLGDLTKSAGKVTEDVIQKAKKIDDEFHITKVIGDGANWVARGINKAVREREERKRREQP